MPFGRHTYGIEAAAQAFFGKTVEARPRRRSSRSPRPRRWLLVSMVKQPNPDPDDPDEFPGYDPTRSAKAEANAVGRWDYVRGQMVELTAVPDKA